jgi:hypothetical protein
MFFVKTAKAWSSSTFTTTTLRTLDSVCCMFGFFWLGVLSESFERFERVDPEVVEIAAQAFKALGIEMIDTPVSDLLIEDKVRILQHAQMLGDGRPANGKSFSDLVDGGWTFGDALKNGQSRGVSQRNELLSRVSHYLP